MTVKEVYKGALETEVSLIDWTPINKAISEKIGVEVECRVGNGIIMNVTAIFDKDLGVEETEHIIIDNECCGKISNRTNFYCGELNPSIFCLNAFEGIAFFKVSVKEGNKKSIAMFPSYFFDIDSDDVVKCLTGEKKSLFEYMGRRYNYNPRIRSNEENILKLVYYKEMASDKINTWHDYVEKEVDV